MPNLRRILLKLCCENGIYENLEETQKNKKTKKKFEQTFVTFFRFYSNVAAYQNREGSVNNFSIHKDYK